MPETFEGSMPPEIESKKRGALLTIWLTIMLITNTGATLTYLPWNSSKIAIFPNVPSWIWYIYGIMGLANVVFTIFLFMWKKWAFFALCGIAPLWLILNLTVGSGIIVSIIGLAGLGILYLIIRSKWSLFE